VESRTSFLLYLLIGGATNLHPYLNALLSRYFDVTTMPDNGLDWYTEPTPRKVKCLMCQFIFARKPTRMLSYLRYKGPSGNCDKDAFVC
jgi:hypothetical protein